tara:strand:- start:17588 stop:19243 length:1656 start_codon:yes stop_codon:yes gene_type:complete
MRIVGLYNWHDGGYCVMEDGVVREHIEFERYTRIKEDGGDSLEYLKDIYLKNNNLTIEDVDAWVSPYPDTNLDFSSLNKFETHKFLPKDKINFYSHHFCHAAHAYYSSPFKDSYIITIDSEGLEKNGTAVSTGGYFAKDNEIHDIIKVPSQSFSLGKLWGRATRYIFKLSAGYPRGHQAGSIMAMAALGDPSKYYEDFLSMATSDHALVAITPPGAKKGVYVPPEEEVPHPYLQKYRVLAEDEQEKFNMAASLQKVTEDLIFRLVQDTIKFAETQGYQSNNICFAGGVALNSVSMGKILSHPELKKTLKNTYIPPVPYDGGLTIGACQHYWHNVLGNEKVDQFVSPYLGPPHSPESILQAIQDNADKVNVTEGIDMNKCVELLVDNKIVAVFQGGSESGRRALGNRSILASPIDPDMKDLINEKVKHRQWYRPFAPSVLEEHGEEWFEGFFPSPYMSFVFNFKEEKYGLAPAVEHFNKSARLQSVNRTQNPLYYDLIKAFYEKTGVPILLNTSFNDREPICETPNHAIGCFLRTDIDYLYFMEQNLLLSKK